ncbi:Hypothetical predicted protein [Cloeon dipterum]|uniref:Uncharacterized protein n=1 Tax=Cloeon dipterum TaxID=197152 RepID=A0A8S1E133_9INSE|nr:Hypothetical predicted protein [Cloeon dipterum]
MRWIWLCAVFLVFVNLHKTNGDDLNKGLFFMERGEVYATTDTWNIQIPVNTKIFTTALADVISNLDGYVQKLKRSGLETIADWVAGQPEYSKIRVGSLLLKHKIGDIFSAIKHLITKRQIENEYHHLHFNWTDVDEINQKLQSHALNGTTEILNLMGDGLTVYNATNNLLNLLETEVYSQLQLAMDIVENLKENSHNPAGRSRKVRQVSDQTEASDKAMISYRKAFDFLEAEIMSLTQAYKLSTLGKLDPFFLPTSILVKILNQIGAARGLLFSEIEIGQESTLQNFYNLAKVSVFSGTDSSDLVLDVKFPVVDDRSRFTVFEPVPWPARLNAKGLFFKINPEADLIAVDQERKQYFLMSFSEFCNCQNSTIKVCHLQKPIRREDEEPNCLLRLLKNDDKDIDNLCNVVTMKTFKTQIIKLTPFSDYIYAVPSDTKLDKTCETKAQAREISDSISGSGTLYVPASCTVRVDGYLLLGSNNSTVFFQIKQNFREIPMPRPRWKGLMAKSLVNLVERNASLSN